MSLSSVTRHLVTELASWAVAGVIAVICLTHFSELKAFAGAAMGVKRPIIAVGQPATFPTTMQAEAPAAETPSGNSVEIRRADDGHYHAEIVVNGRRMSALVDTGASRIAMSVETAESAGVYLKDSDFKYRSNTANGSIRVAMVVLDTVSIGDITLHDVEATVQAAGLATDTLFGMSFLNRLASVEARKGTLYLQK